MTRRLARDTEDPGALLAERAAGDRIADRYQLLRVLDRGGMGVVWVAHHLALDVQVALKLIRPNAAGATSSARLLREAQAAARIDHPAVLRVIDVGTTADGEPFLVMELLDGEPLADVLARDRTLDPTAAVRTILPIVDGLGALHDKGIIHRDIKPENIFLSQSDTGRWQPKLIDFGVARLVDPADGAKITRRGMAVGTPVYMALDQMHGAEADARSDVWSIAVVLYEMIAGELPFDAPTITGQITLLLANAPQPLDVDAALWAIVRRGLALREARWPSARDMGKALAEWLFRRGVTTDITGVSLRARWLDEDDIRRIAVADLPSQISTAQFPAPPRIQALADPSHEEIAKPVASTSTPSAATTLAPIAPPRRAPIAAITIAIVGLGIAIAIAMWTRSPPPSRAPIEASTTPPPIPTSSTPAVVESASASAPKAPPPASISASSAPPRAPRAPKAPALPPGLKDPFR